MSKRFASAIVALLLAATAFALLPGMVFAEEELAAAEPEVISDVLAPEELEETAPVQDGEAFVEEEAAAEALPEEDAASEEAVFEEQIVEPAAESVEEPVVAEAEMTEEELLVYRAEHDLANSFRFSNGVPIEQTEASGGLRLMANNAPAWSYTENGWVNNKGQVIAGATGKGIDVSEWQGTIDWDKVKADGISFAILRVGYSTYKDDCFDRNAKECERVGIPYGVYVYSYAKNADGGLKEAEAVLKFLKGYNPTYPVYIDLEETKEIVMSNGQRYYPPAADDLTGIATAFCTRIEQAGYEAGVYASLSWWNNYLTSSVFNSWTKWVAQYYSECEYTGSYRIWQCTGKGRVAGISVDVDINFEFNGDVPTGLPARNVSGTKSAPIANGEYNIISAMSSSKVIDTDGNSTLEGANIQLWAYTNGGGDRFKLTSDSQGLYTIQNVNSGKYLSLYRRNTSYGLNVVQTASADTLAQKWIIEKDGSSYIIRSAYNTDYVLDVEGASSSDGTNIGIWTQNSGKNQRWTFRSLSYKAEKTVDDGTYIIACKSNSGIVFDVEGQSRTAGANIGFWTANNGENQRFKIKHAGNGYYTITGVQSGMALDVSGESKRVGANLIQWNAGSNKDNQLWAIIKNSDGSYSLASKLSGLLITAASGAAKGSNASLDAMDYSASQRFTLSKVAEDPNRTIADGTYVIESAMSSNIVLDVTGNSTANGANIETWNPNGGTNQLWVVSWDSSAKAYSIKSVRSGLYLDASGASAANGTNIIQWASNGGKNQRWNIVKDGSGYKIVSAMNSKMVIDIEGQSTKTGANVLLWTANGGANQRFVFKSAGSGTSAASSKTGQVLSNGTYEIAPASNTSIIFDVSGESKADRANICLWTDHNGSNQRFRFTWDAAANAYMIAAQHSGSVIDLSGSKAVAGANIQQYHPVGGSDQRWVITKTGDTYTIASKVNPSYYICLGDGTPKAGTNVQLGTTGTAFSIRAV